MDVGWKNVLIYKNRLGIKKAASQDIILIEAAL